MNYSKQLVLLYRQRFQIKICKNLMTSVKIISITIVNNFGLEWIKVKGRKFQNEVEVFQMLDLPPVRRHDTWKNDTRHNDTRHNDTRPSKTGENQHSDAEWWVSFILSMIYAEFHLCSVSFMPCVVMLSVFILSNVCWVPLW